jgi:histidinol-phosphate aminotransferase
MVEMGAFAGADGTGGFDAGSLANRCVALLRAYDPGHDMPLLRQRFGAQIAELGSNENPLGPSPFALAAMRDALEECFRYPDPRGNALKLALAQHLRVHAGCVALGNGSHELLMLLAQCFADPAHSVVFSQYGFAVFPIAAAAAGARALPVSALPRDHLHAPLGHDLDAIAAAVREDTRLVYLANPNNPTGTWFGDEDLERLLHRVPRETLVVVDEAYHEYVDPAGSIDAVPFTGTYPNLVVTRTFSKAHALAGIRIGYLVAHPSVVGVLERLRESFNVNLVALAGARAALADREHVECVREFNRHERTWLAQALQTRECACLPSQANFLLVEPGEPAAALERRLFERGVIVRPMAGYGLGNMLRISVGGREENQRLLDAWP